jgi:hypothetical protein
MTSREFTPQFNQHQPGLVTGYAPGDPQCSKSKSGSATLANGTDGLTATTTAAASVTPSAPLASLGSTDGKPASCGLVPDWATKDGSIRLFLGDCRSVLPTLSGIDAVVTDPPYGIGADEAQLNAAKQRIAAAGKSKAGRGWKYYGESEWDKERPTAETFAAILRVSETAVIWGGNYFADILPPSMGWLAWDKGQREFSLADFELAWTSEWRAARFVCFPRGKAILEGKVHPTQKPVPIMQWSIDWLRLKENAVVCDPFMGSGTTCLACRRSRKRFVGIECDEKYFASAVERIEEELDRTSLLEPAPQIVQKSLLGEGAA